MFESGHLIALPFVAAMFGFPILAWFFIPLTRRHHLAGLAVLLAVFAGLFVWSQLRPGAIAPPLTEWGVASGLAAIPTVIVMVAFAKLDLRGVWGRLFAERFNFTLLLAPVLLTGCCVGGSAFREGSEYTSREIVWSYVAGHEYRPIPPGTTVVKTTEGCLQPSPCPTVVTLATDQAMPGGELAAKLVSHYKAQGWRFAAGSHDYTGCRAVHGILRWADHCIRIPIREGFVTHTELSVNVY